MERLASSAATTSCQERYVSWEEVFVSVDKGKREVRYYLKKRGGGSDLALIGKEKSSRHMSYHYAIRNSSFGPFLKLKSRREVVDWMDSIVSGWFKKKYSFLILRSFLLLSFFFTLIQVYYSFRFIFLPCCFFLINCFFL